MDVFLVKPISAQTKSSVGATLLIGSSLWDLSLCFIMFYHRYRPSGTFLEGVFLE